MGGKWQEVPAGRVGKVTAAPSPRQTSATHHEPVSSFGARSDRRVCTEQRDLHFDELQARSRKMFCPDAELLPVTHFTGTN